MSWRVLTRRSFVPSHHLVEVADAGIADPFDGLRFSESGIYVGPTRVLLTVDSDVLVWVTVGWGGPPRRGDHLGEGVINVGEAGLEVSALPLSGVELMRWPPGRTRVEVFGPTGDPYERRWVAVALTPLDAPPPMAESEADQIGRLTARLGLPLAHEAASESLRRIGVVAVSRLVSMVRDSSLCVEARFGATITLGKIGGAEAVGALVEAISDPLPHVRRGAATGLRQLPKRDARDFVLDALI